VLQKEARDLRLLTTLQHKKELLMSLGVNHVEVIQFTKDFSSMTVEEYLRDIVIGKYGGTALLLGYDNKLGCDAKDADHVARIAESLGLEVIRTDAVSLDPGAAVSSTKIRNRLLDGDVSGAAEMLGYSYSLYGVVVAGNRLGRTIGFPTANMQLYEPLKMVPANGVYFVQVQTLDRNLYGMCNIGCRPTVSEGNARTIETNIFGFDEDIYGLDMTISFVEKIRDEIRFDSLEELRKQLDKDRDTCLTLLEMSSRI
jgi:riboflavin kinase/FMN adenylyltransferase